MLNIYALLLLSANVQILEFSIQLRLSEVIQRFGKNYSCHLQGECGSIGRLLVALYTADNSDHLHYKEC